MLKQLIALVVFLLSSLQCFAEDNQKYNLINFKEHYSRHVEVSSSLLSGYQLEKKPPLKPTPDNLYISKPENLEEIFISVSSIDGTYKAELNIEFPKSKNNWIQIEIPTKYQHQLAKYNAGQLTAFGFTKEKDKHQKSYYRIFPVSWGLPPSDEKNAAFYINSASPITKYATASHIEYCNHLTEQMTTAYNQRCLINKSFTSGDTVTVFKTGIRKKFMVWWP